MFEAPYFCYTLARTRQLTVHCVCTDMFQEPAETSVVKMSVTVVIITMVTGFIGSLFSYGEINTLTQQAKYNVTSFVRRGDCFRSQLVCAYVALRFPDWSEQ